MKLKGLIAIALVFTIALAFCACRKTKSSSKISKDEMFVVDSLGVTHEVETQTNEDTGETEFVYTDDLGNVVVVEREDVGKTTQSYVFTTTGPNGETEPTSKDKGKNDKGDTTESETVPEEILDFFEDLTDPQKEGEYLEEVTTELRISENPINTNNMQPVQPAVVNASGDPVHKDYEDFAKAASTKKQYTIKMNIKAVSDGESMMMPTTVVRSGDNLFVETKWPVEGKSSVTIRILMKDGKCIVYLPSIRAYIEIPEEAAKEMFGVVDYATETPGEKDDSYVESGKVTIDGKTYDCEIYKTDDGGIKKYYYLNDQLKRMEVIPDENDPSEITMVEYESISTSVNTKVFIPPVGYFNLGNVQNSEELLEKIG